MNLKMKADEADALAPVEDMAFFVTSFMLMKFGTRALVKTRLSRFVK